MERENLTVLTDAHALRVLFDGDRASGVEVDHGGQVQEVLAAREVILSAGAYQSPQLLMLSGVGPADALVLFGIEPKVDLPVGEGLQDHCMTLMNWTTDHESLMTALTPENIELLQTEGRGPLSSNIAEAGGFMRTRPGLDAPDYLQSEEDRMTILAGVRMALEIAGQSAMDGVITGEFKVPSRDAGDEELMAFIRENSMTLYHPTSTCAIGPVVDPRLRVHGVRGLRVVDASVMPSVVRGNTNAATIMIAERAVDLIVQDAQATEPAGAASRTTGV